MVRSRCLAKVADHLLSRGASWPEDAQAVSAGYPDYYLSGLIIWFAVVVYDFWAQKDGHHTTTILRTSPCMESGYREVDLGHDQPFIAQK